MRAEAIDAVYQMAKSDPRIVFIGSDLGAGTLDAMRKEMPERFFMEGVSEANIIGMAAGMAMDGFIPYVNTIATFLTRRCLEQVAVDLCLHNLPVRLIANGGGLVYAPLGPTHQAIEDIALLRPLPNMTVLAPCDAPQMVSLVRQTVDWPGPVYIRVGKGNEPVVSAPEDGCRIGRAIKVRDGTDALFVVTGVMLHAALAAAERLAADGIRVGILHLHTVKPLDADAILAEAGRVPLVVTAEEHVRIGGLGSAVAELLADHMPSRGPQLVRLGLPDRFPDDYGSQAHLLERFGLDGPSLAEAVLSRLGHAINEREGAV